jgi:hypothetical protein
MRDQCLFYICFKLDETGFLLSLSKLRKRINRITGAQILSNISFKNHQRSSYDTCCHFLEELPFLHTLHRRFRVPTGDKKYNKMSKEKEIRLLKWKSKT